MPTSTYPSPPMPDDEVERAEAARRADRSGLEGDAVLQGIVADVADCLQIPFAAICIVHSAEQHIVASVGAPQGFYDRRTSFLSHAIAQRHAVFEVLSAADDERFAANPWVAGERGAASYYAAVLLRDDDGRAIGGLSIADVASRRHLIASEVSLLHQAAAAAWRRIAELLRPA